MNLAINGFGRIGRQALRIIQQKHPDMNVVLINDLTDPGTLAHLFEFDSTYGHFNNGSVSVKDGNLITGNDTIKITAEKDPAKLPHAELKVDIVLECTGFFTSKEGASNHLKAGAKKVIISAPAKDAVDGTFCMGVNHETYDPATMHVVSNASCTTNCLAPMVKVLNDVFGIEYGFMTTVHSYTNDQNLLDLPHKDLRRARAAAVNIIPTSTGAAKAIGLVVPELMGKMNGISLRVPTPTGSLNDVTVTLTKPATKEEINAAFKKAAEGAMKGILRVEDRPLVLKDFVGDPASCIIDSELTDVIGKNMVKVCGWYDNEWGYSNRIVELAEYMGSKL
ncbi:MAG: glyceraldehyde-3-phosphate dehydrogenase, type [Candidatus Peribacteria bacterium]|nr:glyceraldehyde-3-phosphate dehydrogenase, type [Candidatus Peribacteria bacterium]